MNYYLIPAYMIAGYIVGYIGAAVIDGYRARRIAGRRLPRAHARRR